MTFKLQPSLATDSYKLSHAKMYPKNTSFVYSNFTPRSNKLFNAPEAFKKNYIVWFGIQATLREIKELWDENFFSLPLETVKEQFTAGTAPFTGDYPVDFNQIAALHTLGYLPIEVKSLPEGAKVKIGVPVFTICNTLPQFYWLTNFLETDLSTESWKAATNTTIAETYRRILAHYAELTGAPKEFIDFQAHDFSARGMSNRMDAAKSGAAHLTSFKGSDTLSAGPYLDYYYGSKGTFVATSVPATEHSVMCIAGKEDEKETIRRLIQDTFPTGIVSVVSDSWDYWKVIGTYAYELKNVILSRQPDSQGFAKTVFRPDSGDPVQIICGKLNPKDNSPEEIGSVETLWNIFGGTINEKGFKTLNQKVGLIYGDSITMQRAVDILQRLMDKGFASDNIVFGVGSFTYQFSTRDTFGFAMKATYGIVDGKPVEIFKDPSTDNGTKRSARGLLRVLKVSGEYTLFDRQTPLESESGELERIFHNGYSYNTTTLEEIRNRIKND
jgi:nicotinamide phosphoribosyltransferase